MRIKNFRVTDLVWQIWYGYNAMRKMDTEDIFEWWSFDPVWPVIASQSLIFTYTPRPDFREGLWSDVYFKLAKQREVVNEIEKSILCSNEPPQILRSAPRFLVCIATGGSNWTRNRIRREYLVQKLKVVESKSKKSFRERVSILLCFLLWENICWRNLLKIAPGTQLLLVQQSKGVNNEYYTTVTYGECKTKKQHK